MSTYLPIDSIAIGERHRKDMGDIKSLAASIQQQGLFHPVVVTSEHTLVAGHRRLEACKALGVTDIAVTVVDVDDLLIAERDENVERKDFTPSEAVAIGRLIEERLRERAQRRAIEGRSRGGKKSGAVRRGELVVESTTSSDDDAVHTRDIAAKAVGFGVTKYSQAREVVTAAETDPTQFGDLLQSMDTSGQVAPVHKELRRRQIIGVADKPKPPRKAAGAPVVIYKGNPPDVIVGNAVVSIETICDTLEKLDPETLSSAALSATALKACARRLSQFANQITRKRGTDAEAIA